MFKLTQSPPTPPLQHFKQLGFAKYLYRALIVLCLTSCTSLGDRPSQPIITAVNPAFNDHVAAESTEPTLTLVSLNLAHGRSDSFSQLLLSGKTIRHNLDNVAHYLQKVKADVVALQEADGPSNWSGKFDHVDHLAREAGYYGHVRSEHVNNWFGDYGTGLLSQLPIVESFGVTFQPTPPTTRKGFTLASIQWRYDAARDPITVDVVSLHLDFARNTARKRQIMELLSVMRQRHNPTIIMGDFNNEWIATSFTTENFARFRTLHTIDHKDSLRFSYGDKRLDWVLLSDELQFISYDIDDVELSDHRPVRVTIKYSPPVLTAKQI